jgi:hypothetical protein
MDSKPTPISGLIKLTKLSYLANNKSRNAGFVSLETAEPSLGLPSGRTLTQAGTGYYFPVFAISDDYSISRQYTGNDTLTFKNRNVGYNTVNPIFNFDINGSLRATNANIVTLSTAVLSPITPGGSLSLNYTGGVQISSTLNVLGNVITPNISASTITTNRIVAASAFFVNTYLTVFTLTGADIFVPGVNAGDVTTTGNVTATNVFAASSVRANTLSASRLITNSLTANTLTVLNNLSVGQDLFATQVYGRLDLDPTSALYYNSNNRLSYTGSLNYEFAVYPGEPNSTDDPNEARTSGGAVSAEKISGGALKPFFKTITGALNYAKVNGLFGNALIIRVYGDIVEGENRPNTLTTLTDDSGKYSGLTTRTGNLTSAFYSSEWLQANRPALYNAGIRGGEFIWSLDEEAPYGEVQHINVENLDFPNIFISGRQNIGNFNNRKDNTGLIALNDATTPFYTYNGIPVENYDWDRNVFNIPPTSVAFRVYVCSNSTLKFGQFTNNPADWQTVKTTQNVVYRPFYSSNSARLHLFNICFEIDSSALYTSCLDIERGEMYAANVTLAALGNTLYHKGLIHLESAATVYTGWNIMQIDPFYLFYFNAATWPWPTRSINGSPTFANPYTYPAYGFAFVGNPKGKSPTNISNGINTDTGFINSVDGANFRARDYGGGRQVGRYSQLPASILLDGSFNGSCFCRVQNGSYLMLGDQLYKTQNFGLSTQNITFNDIGATPSYLLQYYTENDPQLKYNFEYIKYISSFSTIYLLRDGTQLWGFNPDESAAKPSYENNTFISIDNGADDTKYRFLQNGTVDLSASLASFGQYNNLLGHNDVGTSVISNRYLGEIASLDDLQLFDTTDIYKISSPLSFGNFYTLNFYTSSLR